MKKARQTSLEAFQKMQTEEEFRQQVIEVLKLFGWHYYFTWHSLHSPRGFPDIVAIKEFEDGTARLLAIECKVGNKQPTPEQVEWLRLFNLVPGCRAYCVRPSDWDELIKVLKGEQA